MKENSQKLELFRIEKRQSIENIVDDIENRIGVDEECIVLCAGQLVTREV